MDSSGSASGDAAAPCLRSLVSVSAPLDVAAARRALFNEFLVRGAGGRLTIRWVDDSAGTAAAADERDLLDDLAWLGIGSDAELVRTSMRRPAYADYAQRLVSRGCAVETGGSLRLRIGPGETVIDDAIKGRVTFENEVLGNPVLVDSAGAVNPAFAAAIDDLLLGSTLVVREDRELEHAAWQQHLFAALEHRAPRWAHFGVLLPDIPDSGELPTVGRLRRDGIQPAALVNHLALLGWSPPNPQESFLLPELSAAFSLDRLGHAPSHFNAARLRAFNARALRALPREQLAAQLAVAMQRVRLLETPAPDAAWRWIDTFLDAYGNEFATLNEALAHVAELRAEAVMVPALELEKLRNRQVVFYLDAVGQYVDAQAELRDLPLAHDLPAIAQEFGIPGGDTFGAVRMALTGKPDGVPLHLLFPLLGHDRILIRIGAISSHLLHGRGLEPIKYGPGGVPFETIRPERPNG